MGRVCLRDCRRHPGIRPYATTCNENGPLGMSLKVKVPSLAVLMKIDAEGNVVVQVHPRMVDGLAGRCRDDFAADRTVAPGTLSHHRFRLC